MKNKLNLISFIIFGCLIGYYWGFNYKTYLINNGLKLDKIDILIFNTLYPLTGGLIAAVIGYSIYLFFEKWKV